MICVTYFVNSVGVLDSWCGLVLWFRGFELFLICYAVGLVADCCCLLLQLRLLLFACVSVLVVWVVYIGRLGCGLGLMFVSWWCVLCGLIA